LHLSVSNNYNL